MIMRRLLLLAVIGICSIAEARGAYIQDNAYRGITISFSEKVQLARIDFEKLKVILRNASEYLYHATKRRAYFGEFVFSVPPAWSSDEICEDYILEAPRHIDVYLTDSTTITTLKAQHSKGCGKPGDVIYMPQSWLRGNVQNLARQFVQQWSTFRYGVFEERPNAAGACVSSKKQTWMPVGCYNIDFHTEMQVDRNGLPVCYFSDDFFQHDDLHSSVMSISNSSKVTDFCDGSQSFPHDPVMPTFHNSLCRGSNVWFIIKSSDDFAYGKNLPTSKEESTMSSFRCFREPTLQVTFAVQNSTYKTSKDAARYAAFLDTIVELRYALLHFLSHMAPKDSEVNLLTFSDEPTTEAGTSVELNLERKNELEEVLSNRIGMEKISNICLLCGLRKALNVSQSKEHPFPVVVVIAWESSLLGEKTSDLIDEIKRHPKVILHFVFIEDTDADVIPPAFVDAVRATRGQIFNLEKEAVIMSTQLNQALVNVFKNPLHIEDKILVIHQKTYTNVRSNIVDTFLIQQGAVGEVLYIMHCNNNDMISSDNESCAVWDQKSKTYKCGEISKLTDDKGVAKTWKYSFQYKTRPFTLTCSSLAMLTVASSSDNSFTLRGWLSEDNITPGYNALIIYAEIIETASASFRVEARVSGPGNHPLTIELRDNGNGDPDVKKGDGVYSRYFTSFSEKGTYAVTLYAESIEKDKARSWRDSGQTDPLTQTKVIGSFTVLQSAPEFDIYPPNRVVDLEAVSVNALNRTITLRWTAPGNDYDLGSAMKYEIKYSTEWTNLLDLGFDVQENATLEPVSPLTPAESGQQEMLQFYIPNTSGNIFIALRAIDEELNMGLISNIIQIHLTARTLTTTDLKPSTEDTQFISSVDLTTDSNTTREATSDVSGNTGDYVTATDKPTTPPSQNMDDYLEKKLVIIISAGAGCGILLLIILINVIVCCCCIMKRERHPEPTRRLSRRTSMRPPYNLNIAYKQGSATSLNTDNNVCASMSSLVEQGGYFDPRARSSMRGYSYHTSKSLLNKNEATERDLGFKLVQAMPAYATTTLSKLQDRDDESGSAAVKAALPEPQKPRNAGETQVYPLGLV